MRRPLLITLLSLAIVATGLAVALAARSGSPQSSTSGSSAPQEVAWLDTAGEVTVLRNPAQTSDAVQHRGSFSVGPGGCLYVTVVDDSGSRTYLAGVSPTAAVTEQGVADGAFSYPLGADATFSGTMIVGGVPDSALQECSGADDAFGLELAAPAE